jgi:VanZ family protein
MGLTLSDVIYHAVGYFGLSILLFLVMLAYGVGPVTRVVGLLAIMAVYGAFDEISQGWVGRDPDIGDWLADMLGVVTAWLTGRALASLGQASGPADPAD